MPIGLCNLLIYCWLRLPPPHKKLWTADAPAEAPADAFVNAADLLAILLIIRKFRNNAFEEQEKS